MRNETRDCETGFTVIELVMVIAIIGILASLAVSAYQTYTVRAQVAEGLDLGAAAKNMVISAFDSTGEPPADRLAAGMSADATDSSGRYVSQINIVDGRIDVTMGNQVHAGVLNDTISFTPYMMPAGGIVWRCGAASAPARDAVPLNGGGTSSVHRPTTVEARYLPPACRN